jgi:RND family efflux transporter MFP subunit
VRTFLSLIIATAVLFGAYTVTFGLPDRVATLMNITSNDESAAAEPGLRPAGNRPGGGNRATTIVTVPLAFQPYETVLNTIGTATAQRSAEVISDAAGEVIEVNLIANTNVEVGDVLLRLDDRTETLNLEIVQAQLDQANETVARYERLSTNGNSTVTDVTLSEARIAQRLAQANVGLSQLALDDRTVRAPIAGRLGLSDIEIGDILTTNDAIVTIDNDNALLVEFELPERAIGILTEATNVLASTPTFTGRVFNGEIVSFDSRLDSVTRSVTVKARIENETGVLWPGMTFTVRMLHKGDPLPAVPSTAITWSRAGSSVWIDTDGVASQIPIAILYRQNETVWIDGDVSEGTLVVTEGAQKLRDGARISTPGSDRPERGPQTPRPSQPDPDGDADVRSEAKQETLSQEEPT